MDGDGSEVARCCAGMPRPRFRSFSRLATSRGLSAASGLLLAAVSLACGDDSGGARDPTSPTEDTTHGVGETTAAEGESSTGSPPVDVGVLASCPEDDLLVLPFAGPAFDPDTGELVEPLPLPHVVATTAGWHQQTDNDVLEMHTMLAIDDVFQRDGLLGATFGVSEACDSARTITLWRDEAAMMEFVLGDVHAAAMAAGASEVLAWETTRWTESTSDAPPTWERARQQLDDVRR